MTLRAILPAVREPLREVSGVPRELQQVQRNVKVATRDARGFTPTKGRLLSGVTLTTAADTVIDHKLGRTPTGYEIRRATGAFPQHYEVSKNSRQITLHNDGGTSAVCDIWVY